MKYVYLPIPVPTFGIPVWVKDIWTEWKYRKGDETPRPIEVEKLRVEKTFRYSFPKNLGSPDADQDLQDRYISEAIEVFRLQLETGTPIASSFIGSSPVKVISPPICESKKLGDILKYEAKQTIPFDLRDVQWRYLPAGDQTIEEGYHVEGNILLTACKNDVVEKALKNFGQLKGQVDLLTNGALIVAEVGRLLVTDEPDSATAVLEMHSEHCDLVVVDRKTVWHRTIPLGGNHFTRNLGKDLKLTFAKAEHLKIDAMQADDPKLIFQAMRPTFNDLSTEVGRSLGFWKSLHKRGKIEGLHVTGGPSKLPGLVQYLNKNFGVPVSDLDSTILASRTFGRKDDDDYLASILLAAQRLGYGMFRTNHIPKSLGFGLGSEKAWGVTIGNAGITAAKVSLKS